jgi:hypothetical protein
MGKVLPRVFFVCVLCAAVCGLSPSASAALTAGVWDSTNGLVQTGTWVETMSGSWPGYSGSYMYIRSDGWRWGYSGSRGPSYTLDGSGSETGGYYLDYTIRSCTGQMGIIFTDGEMYTAYTTGDLSYRMHFSLDDRYLVTDRIVLDVQGPVDGTNFFLGMTVMGYETYNEYPGEGLNHGGLITGAAAVISAVPVPPALWLLGSGLAGLLGLRRGKGSGARGQVLHYNILAFD